MVRGKLMDSFNTDFRLIPRYPSQMHRLRITLLLIAVIACGCEARNGGTVQSNRTSSTGGEFSSPHFRVDFSMDRTWVVVSQQEADNQLKSRGLKGDSPVLILTAVKKTPKGVVSLNAFDSQDSVLNVEGFLQERTRRAKEKSDNIEGIAVGETTTAAGVQYRTLSYVDTTKDGKFYYQYWATGREGRILMFFARMSSHELLPEIENLLLGDG